MNTKTQVIWSYIRSLPINASFTAAELLQQSRQIDPSVSSGSVSGLLSRLTRLGTLSKAYSGDKVLRYTLHNYDYAWQIRSAPSKGGKPGRMINRSKTLPLNSAILAAPAETVSQELTSDTTGKYVVIEGPLFAGCDVEEPTHIFESFCEAHTYASEQLRSTPTVEFVILKTVEIVRATVSIHSMPVDS